MTGATLGRAWIRTSRRNRCPVCDHPDWCSVTPDGNACCMRVPSDRQLKNGGWWHNGGMSPTGDTVRLTITKELASPRAPIEQRDQVYRALGSVFGLNAADRRHLVDVRGLPPDVVDGYVASVPELTLTQSIELAQRVVQVAGVRAATLRGIPGFFSVDDDWALTRTRSGFTIPALDAYGRIQALLMRRARPRADASRYVWLSSAHSSQGCSSGAPVAVWRPELAVEQKAAVITEGPLKAAIVAYRMPAAVLAVPGVSNWRSAIDVLRELGVLAVTIAYDADASINPTVAMHREALAHALTVAGFGVQLADWDLDRGKGLDDLLLAGYTPDIRAWRLVSARGVCLPPLLRPTGAPLPPLVRPLVGAAA